ncbi:GTP 3',8-cyclase MoaA [Leucobacter sp. CSA1]|uniref:GTP 3',8-cyclase n=1 Tax=Leucobacter chromiisoli TaxID=2796471 RepID=A0A934Q3A0_9MICO|nr:GTP 3',8-cyclase MoaA [Leucobacter chromiisoli]MBK0417614.1 GTP 3',8-cyclase MoaA [Leucobacter chromiisoli]
MAGSGIRALPATGTSPGRVDALGRELRDLRISVTDRCNFRCVYCMPKEIFGRDYQFLERSELLTFEEITRLAAIAAGLGVRKLRLTGGEPLLRRGIEDLVAMLAELRTPDGEPLDLALTTNGSALPVKAAALKAAGLGRVTVSLDSLDEARFQAINDVRFPVSRVLDGIAAAAEAGLGPIKVNTVVKRGVNDDEVLGLAEHFRGTGHALRFIEYMDVGSSNGWALEEVVPSAEIVARIGAVHPLDPVPPDHPGETARRWRYRDGSGEIGVISSVTQAFCGSCTRARLSAEGRLFTCLFATTGFDLRALLRGGASDAEISDALSELWGGREDRYSERRSEFTAAAGAPAPGSEGGEGSATDTTAAATADAGRTRQRIEMSYIGG